MRHTLVFGLTLFVFTVAAGADTPIPQDTARMEKRRRERLEWNRRTFQGAYDKVGKKDPRWDEPARKAMDLAARMISKEVDPEITFSDLHQPAKAAIDAGCDDPLLVYLYNRSLVGPNDPGEEETIARMRASAKALAASRYPAFRRAITLELAGTYALSAKEPSEASRKEAERDFDAALALLPESVANDEHSEFWEDKWFDTVCHVFKGYRQLGVDATTAYDRVDAELAKRPELKVLRLQFRGDFWTMYGWEARTTAFAPFVPAGGFEKLEKRLAVAREALDEAWRLRPDDARTAVSLLGIERSVGGDRATMELWFDRAMKADGDSYSACFSKLYWLDPKWHGTVEEMLAFGRACRATKNWRAGITLLAAEAHYHYASELGHEERSKYLGSPAVWSEIKSVFDEYLKHHPTNDVARSKYAAMAVMATKYPEAFVQFQALGDRLTTWPDFPYVPLEELKRIRDVTARLIAEKMDGDKPGRRLAGWLRFHGRNNGGEWTVNVPVRPERRQEAGILGARAHNVFTCTAEGITYTVRVQLVPLAARAGGAEAVLDAARDAIAKEHGGQVRDKHPALLSELPAQEYLIDAPALQPAVVRVRSGVIGDRLYELSVSAREADVSGAAAIKFLESFKFQQ